MIYLAIAELVVIAVLAVLFYCLAAGQDQRLLDREAAWREERAELLTRIQRPEMIPVRQPTEPREIPDRDELHKVGSVALSDDYLKDEE